MPHSAWEEYDRRGWAVYTIPKNWIRVDLDGNSCSYNYGKSAQFLVDNSESLRAVLGDNKYRLLELASRESYHGTVENHVTLRFNTRIINPLTKPEMEEFETLLAEYQHEILRKYFP